MKFAAISLIGGLILTGCSAQNPARPDSASAVIPNASIVSSTASVTNSVVAELKGGSKPSYEPAYYNNTVVTINAIEVPQNAGPLAHAAADFYVTAYPPDRTLWPDTPQCNPCDHAGDGIDFSDFHNHVLDSIPSDPGHGEFNPLWHVFAIIPADFSHAGQVAYAARLPMKSEADVDAAIEAGVAQEIDTQFYFLCAVVSDRTAH